jgi:hypothetical protein
MEPKTRTQLAYVENWLSDSRITIHRMEKRLRSHSEEIPPEFSQASEAAATCLESMENLHSKIDAIFEMDELEAFRTPSDPLTDSEVAQLLKLNRQLKDVTRHLQSVKNDVTPRLEAKLADPKDPMYDYEIEVRIDYQLREDDPAFAEDDDNFLSTRNETLKLEPMSDDIDWSESYIQPSLRAEPHCWLFHDLYDHAYGRESPRVPLCDCLRIGKVFVDVQIWQQYCFDVE